MNVLQIALTPKNVLLIGAGNAAALKAKNILQSDCNLKIVAKEITNDFFLGLDVDKNEFNLLHVKDIDIIVDATGNRELAEFLYSKRKEFGYILNCVDIPEFCDFYFGASFKNHDLSINVSSGGSSPKYAQTIRDTIKEVIPSESKEFYQKLKEQRLKGNTTPRVKQEFGSVALIGCGTGSVDNLTLKALKAIKKADVALIDFLVGKGIVELLPKDCVKIDVSKKKGFQKFSQEQINEMMFFHAKEGNFVARLKGGDPMIFGRVFEEANYLFENDIQVEIINGVSSFLVGCAVGGVTPTLREFSAGALVVSAHLRESVFNDSWIKLLKDFPYTVVVLMAYSFADKIVNNAKEKGINLELPAAFVSSIDRAEQTTVIGQLKDLEKMVKLCTKPAILIIGKSVSEAHKMPHFGKRVFV
ncbi:MAG: siroheme synthase [Campylobacteraceae bacterium]